MDINNNKDNSLKSIENHKMLVLKREKFNLFLQDIDKCESDIDQIIATHGDDLNTLAHAKKMKQNIQNSRVMVEFFLGKINYCIYKSENGENYDNELFSLNKLLSFDFTAQMDNVVNRCMDVVRS